MTSFETKIVNTATNLLKNNKLVTTLAIKNECRKLYPNDKFYQVDVSEIMSKIAPSVISNLEYIDNGTYREYYIDVPVQQVIVAQANIIPTSKKDMVRLLRANVGKFFGITFTKKDGTQRTLNAHMSDKKFINDLGYLQVITSKGEYKQIDPKKILEITINGNKYVAK